MTANGVDQTTTKLMTVAQILAANRREPPGGAMPMLDIKQAINHPVIASLIESRVEQAKTTAGYDAGAYYLQAMMTAIEAAFGNDKLAAGAILDEALTHFLASLAAELGKGYARNAAARLIRNLALWLTEAEHDGIFKVIPPPPAP